MALKSWSVLIISLIIAIVPNPAIFHWIATSVADIPVLNSNENKTFQAIDVGALFVNGKATVVNGLRKLGNYPSWLVLFLVDSFDKLPRIFEWFFISLFLKVNLNKERTKFLFNLFINNINSSICKKIII